jgi:hypothetical protein
MMTFFVDDMATKNSVDSSKATKMSADSSKARFEKICFWQFATADFVAGRIGMIK